MTLFIGSDPEFSIYNILTDEYIFAHSVIEGRTGERVRIGTNGCPETGEIRPPYASSPIDHYDNVNILLQELYRYLNRNNGDKYAIIAGNGGQYFSKQNITAGPTGGHIHFSIPLSHNRLIEMLDLFLSIPALFIEQQPYSSYRRHVYSLSNHRNQPWGFEYRVPFSWLIHPDICKGTLCLAYSIVSYYKDNDLNQEVRDLSSLVWNNTEFRNCNLNFFREHLPSLISQIRRLPLYSSFQNEIEYLLNRIRKGENWYEEINAFYNWGLSSKEWLANPYAFVRNNFNVRENIQVPRQPLPQEIELYSQRGVRIQDGRVNGFLNPCSLSSRPILENRRINNVDEVPEHAILRNCTFTRQVYDSIINCRGNIHTRFENCMLIAEPNNLITEPNNQELVYEPRQNNSQRGNQRIIEPPLPNRHTYQQVQE